MAETTKKKRTLKVPKEFYYGTGKRKTAIAKVWLFKGNGTIIMNNKAFEEYLPSETQRQTVTKGLAKLGLEGKYDCIISALGGGVAGQVDAAKLGVARALLSLNEEHRKALKEDGLLSRDSREKERKKYGLRGARKAPTYRKR